MAGRAKGKAIEKAAAEGIPDRMWSRLGERGIAERLQHNDFTEVAGGVDELEDMLQEAGIDATVSNTDRARDTLAIAKEVMGLVYLNVMDSVIYADAIAAQAEQIISEDGYFKKTVNDIKRNASPGGTGALLQERVAGLLSRDPDSVTLPDAEGVPGKSGKGH